MVYSPRIRLSASRLKCYEECSEIYYFKYLLKGPDEPNAGNTMGTILHDICEILLNKNKYFSFVEGIIQTNLIPKQIERYFQFKLKKTDFYSLDNIKTLGYFFITALKNDFWMNGGDLQPPEVDFEIKKDYWITGFVDKYAIYKDKDDDYYAIIYDLKTQKKQFTKYELKTNLQAFIYLLAIKQKHPEINLLKSKVKFIMLRFSEDPIQEFQLTGEDHINGFEEYLRYMQKEIDSFSEKDRSKNLAANMGFLPESEGFKGLLKCNIHCKYAGQLKKNGDVMWACPQKFPFTYYVPIKNNKEEKGFRDVKLVDKFKNKGYTIETRRYSGCPHWNKEDLL